MKDKDLAFFKALLLERKVQILKNVDDNIAEIKGLKDTHASDEADFASISIDSAIEEAINTQQMKELNEINYALQKIRNKTYGVCEMCEEKIGMQRLKVKPQAKYCIVCREIIEKTSDKG